MVPRPQHLRRAFDASSFSKNRERLLAADVARAFFAEVVAEAKRRRLLSAEHFTVDGTLLEAWASLKSYRPRDEQEPPPGGRNPDVDFRGRRRSRDTHSSGTDPQARLYTKGSGQTAKLSYMGHLLTENRHGLVLDVEPEANGYAEREAAVTMLERSVRLLGADRGYDTRDFVAALRARGVTPHVAARPPPPQRRGRAHRSRLQAESEATQDRGAVFGWLKTVGGGRKLVSWAASATAAGWSSPLRWSGAPVPNAGPAPPFPTRPPRLAGRPSCRRPTLPGARGLDARSGTLRRVRRWRL